MKKIINLLVITFGLFAQNGLGSDGAFDPTSYGMANTYVVSSRGIYSFGKNPANLVQSNIFGDNYNFDLYIPLLPSLKFSAYRNFMTFEEINYFFGGVKGANGETVGRKLTNSDKNKFKDIFSNDAKMELSINTSLLAFSYNMPENYGSFGFALNSRFVSDVQLPKSFFHFLIDNINLPEGTNSLKLLNFNKLNIKAGVFTEYNFSYSRYINEVKIDGFKNISAGLSFKIVNGLAYAKTQSNELSILTENLNNNVTTTITNKFKILIATSPDMNVKYDFDSIASDGSANVSPFSKPAGSGLGFDIGFSASTSDDLFLLGFAITDIGSVKWDKKIAVYEANNSRKITSFTDKKQTENLGDSLKYYGRYTGSFTTSLPTALRIGVATELQKFIKEIPGRLFVEFNYNQGFNNELGNSTTPRFSLGFNYNIPSEWAPYIRTGFSAGGKYGFNWAFGLGFDTGLWEFDIATLDLYSLFAPNSSRKFNFAIGNRWKF